MDEITGGFTGKTLILSAVKPYLNGKNFNNISTDVTEELFGGMVANATVQRGQNILVESRPFLFILLIVVIALLVLLNFLTVLVDEDNFQTFDLKNVGRFTSRDVGRI
jgi:hypothetical protein